MTTDYTPSDIEIITAFLSSEATQNNVRIAIKATLDSLGHRQKLGRAISTQDAVTVIALCITDALKFTVEGDKVTDEQDEDRRPN